ncbi:MOSC domain-containing protein [Microlunatus soli]|uniref:MOSC domain-containing protein YiiM n=1 Tax=Microlunatus soli TaxID=630515 RepID=A0A1H1WJ81_9ACTN|nr:MOSC domain-containing protein [Microlunatus soli]SDS97193.1 MOSC domain-containing protein YiiM [Microlunatus soli]
MPEVQPVVASVNIASAMPNPYKQTRQTGIGKMPVDGRVEVRAPGPKHGGLGSGLVGDFIGDTANHGGDEQAVYSFTREDLDAWERRLGRDLPSGFFGENLTTVGIDVNQARIGERWQIGEPADGVELEVTCPRIPCSTFRGWVGEKGWLKTFTEVARPGAYLRVVRAGTVGAGDPITISRPRDHDVTISKVYRATTTERHLLPELLAAGDDLSDELRQIIADRGGFDLF